jgi:hypothetical protein
MNPNKIFEVFIEFSEVLHKAARRREEIDRLNECSRPKCGNCDHWMKTRSCPAEARGDKRSMDGLACNLFKRTRFAEESFFKLKELTEAAK